MSASRGSGPRPARPPRNDDFRRPLSELVDALTEIESGVGAREEGGRIRVERIDLELPVELREEVDDQGDVSFRASPPTQQIRTTVFPVLHQFRIGVTVEEEGDGGS